MENNKIIVHFARVKNVLIAKLVEFPEDLRGKGVIIENDDYSIRSVGHSEMTACALYLSGHSTREENLFAYTFLCVDEAKEAVKNWKQLIQEYNSRDETDEDSISVVWERAE